MTAIYDGLTWVGQMDLNQLLKSAANYRERLPQVGVSKFGGASHFIFGTCMDNVSDYFEQAEAEFKRTEEDMPSGSYGSEE